MPRGRTPDELSPPKKAPAASNGHRVVEVPSREVTHSVTETPRRNHSGPSQPRRRLRRRRIRSGDPNEQEKRRPRRGLMKLVPTRPKTSKDQPKPKKQKRPRMPVSARFIQGAAAFLLVVVLPLGAARAFTANSKVTTETQARRASDARIESQLKTLGTSSDFPLAQATAVADRLAYECFTVPTALPNPNSEDPASLQDKALANAGIPAGDRINCGWNGQGRGKLDDHDVVADPYWVHGDHATVILQLKLYQRPGFFYYYVPFRNVHGVAKISGMPAIFGTDSGAEDFMSGCREPGDSVNIGPLRHTAQLFLSALAGARNIDLGYLLYKDAKFGGFGPSVSSPKITDAKYCGTNDGERRFAAMVQFNGPVKGSRYTLPYGFVMVPNPQTSGKYQVKDFGPAPGYTGE